MLKNNITYYNFIYILITALLLMAASSVVNMSCAESSKGVLVVAESSSVQKISVLEIRRIYLGLPPSSPSLIKKPVINLSDRIVYKVFLKNIMHMTQKGYQRKIVKRMFRQGGEKIKHIQDINKLVEYLKNNPNDISFMDEKTAKKTKGIRIVQKLW